jgi:hypothetical protein
MFVGDDIPVKGLVYPYRVAALIKLESPAVLNAALARA